MWNVYTPLHFFFLPFRFLSNWLSKQMRSTVDDMKSYQTVFLLVSICISSKHHVTSFERFSIHACVHCSRNLQRVNWNAAQGCDTLGLIEKRNVWLLLLLSFSSLHLLFYFALHQTLRNKQVMEVQADISNWGK